MLDTSKMVADILDFGTEEDLLELNKVLIEKIKLKRKIESIYSINSFSVGDKVSFVGRRKLTVTGTIIKVKKTNVLVKEAGIFGTTWNVPAGSLTLISKSNLLDNVTNEEYYTERK